MSKLADAKIDWDDVDWENTHMAVSSGLYHLGIVDSAETGRVVALGVSTAGDEATSIMLLDEDDVDDFMKWLRQTAKSL